MTSALPSLYQGIILEHNARPRNRGRLAGFTHEGSSHNALCGDTIVVRLRIDGASIVEAAFEGDGCALCLASASLLTLVVQGRPRADALARADALDALVSRGSSSSPEDWPLLGELVALGGVRDVPARRRCATLPWEALRLALRST